jgi:hypothetical protein
MEDIRSFDTAFEPDKTWKKAEQVGRFHAGILMIRA